MEIVQGCLISKIRSRNAVLGMLVPKILGILNSRGKLHGFNGRSVQLNETIVLSAFSLDARRLMMSVYAEPTPDVVKVLSLHVTSFPSAVDPNFYRYRGGRVAVMSWRRGEWEDDVMGDQTAPLSISEHFAKGADGQRTTAVSRAEPLGLSGFTK